MHLKKLLLGCCLLPAVLFLVSCQTLPQDQPPTIAVYNVVVLHVASLQTELADAAGPLYQALVKRMEQKGYHVVSLSPEQYRQLHEDALVVSGSVYDPSVRQFVPLDRSVFIKAQVDLAASAYAADLVLMPELVLRTTTVAGDNMAWDGVEREIEFADRPPTAYRLPEHGKGLSLRLAGYTRNGAEVFLGFSGISLPYQVRYQDGKLVLEMKKEFFTSSEINEGVKLALQPFFKQVKQKNGK